MDIKRVYSVETTLTAQKVCQLINDGKVNDLPLQAQIAINSALQVNSVVSTAVSSMALYNTHVLVLYAGVTNYLWSVILTISGTSIAVGTPISSK